MLTTPSRMLPASYDRLSKLRDRFVSKRASRISSYRSNVTVAVYVVSRSSLTGTHPPVSRCRETAQFEFMEHRPVRGDQPDGLGRTGPGGFQEDLRIGRPDALRAVGRPQPSRRSGSRSAGSARSRRTRCTGQGRRRLRSPWLPRGDDVCAAVVGACRDCTHSRSCAYNQPTPGMRAGDVGADRGRNGAGDAMIAEQLLDTDTRPIGRADVRVVHQRGRFGSPGRVGGSTSAIRRRGRSSHVSRMAARRRSTPQWRSGPSPSTNGAGCRPGIAARSWRSSPSASLPIPTGCAGWMRSTRATR